MINGKKCQCCDPEIRGGNSSSSRGAASSTTDTVAAATGPSGGTTTGKKQILEGIVEVEGPEVVPKPESAGTAAQEREIKVTQSSQILIGVESGKSQATAAETVSSTGSDSVMKTLTNRNPDEKPVAVNPAPLDSEKRENQFPNHDIKDQSDAPMTDKTV